ncbi:hypothetical protein [uncultured Winogradskyella sp.]|uniref:hypothetical protein n=1 Tax=uncultured Winogradskyella sp. TaxID=395353 RepID=UPI002639ED96|nr:hypothetical protein [uncultured Winogradskyella sp.]
MKLLMTSIFLFVFASTITAQDWKKYKSEELAFVTEFPGTPEESVQKVQTAVGELDMNMVGYTSVETGDNAYYSVISSDYPEEKFSDISDEKIKSILDGAVNGAVKNTNGTLEFDENITLNGYPGRKIMIKSSGMELYMNAYLVGNVMYITQVIALEGKVNTKNLNKFMDAFDLINKKE